MVWVLGLIRGGVVAGAEQAGEALRLAHEVDEVRDGLFVGEEVREGVGVAAELRSESVSRGVVVWALEKEVFNRFSCGGATVWACRGLGAFDAI